MPWNIPYYLQCFSPSKHTFVHNYIHSIKVHRRRSNNIVLNCILKERSPGMIMVLSSLFVHAGFTPPVNDIEQICRCPGEKSNVPNLCHKLPRLLNYAIYNKMTCMLHPHLLAVTITFKQIFKIWMRNTFFAAFFTTSQHPAP